MNYEQEVRVLLRTKSSLRLEVNVYVSLVYQQTNGTDQIC